MPPSAAQGSKGNYFLADGPTPKFPKGLRILFARPGFLV